MRGTVVNAFDLLLSYVGARHSRSSEAALAAALYQPPSIAAEAATLSITLNCCLHYLQERKRNTCSISRYLLTGEVMPITQQLTTRILSFRPSQSLMAPGF
jgi:hypothetical protein